MESDGGSSVSNPIYFFPGKHYSQAHLNIVIPKKFKEIAGTNDFFKEFVFFETPNQNNWSERIYTHFALNSTAQNELINLRSIILKDCSNVKTKYVSIENMITHTIGTAIISYTAGDKNIFVFARYISGLNCCSGFQYYINATSKNHREVIKRLKDFAEYQTELKNWGHSKNEQY